MNENHSKVQLADEVTVVRAMVDGRYVGSVYIGPRGGWKVTVVNRKGQLTKLREWYGSKNSATAELVRRAERIAK